MITLNGTTGITNDGGYTGDGVVFADTTPANTLVTTTGGNVGIGTSSPLAGAKVEIVTGQDKYLDLTSSSGTYGLYMSGDVTASHNIVIGGFGTQPLTFATQGNERMRIDSSGNLLVGTTNADAKTTIYGTSSNTNTGILSVRSNYSGDTGNCAASFVKFDNNSTTSQVFIKFGTNQYGGASGQINANGANACAFGAFSDSRLKRNIVELPSQLANIMALRPVEFDYIEEEGGGHQIGFIAQEIQAIYPDAVGVRSPDEMLTVTGWSKTEARLIKAIQELKAIVDAQGAEIAALKGTQP
jgi:hypothetical protein